MHALVIAASVFGITFLGELPDKSLFASLVMSTRYRRLPVWAGAAAAFAVHVGIAIAAGQLLTLLPRGPLEAVIAALFLAGAAYLLISSLRSESESEDADAARQGGGQLPFLKVAATSFGVIFLSEWGDITQFTTANLAARYAAPVSVAAGAILGLWAVTAVAVNVGSKSLQLIPMAWVQRITGTILLGFGIYSVVQAVAA
ncbi:MAG TPA: TMEM165/GDT1 family protein [Streptosporangiaceae bacterium]|nr:TMEM165/GDT1 family protein [Streptosporangiaceae bacterium]